MIVTILSVLLFITSLCIAVLYVHYRSVSNDFSTQSERLATVLSDVDFYVNELTNQDDILRCNQELLRDKNLELERAYKCLQLVLDENSKYTLDPATDAAKLYFASKLSMEETPDIVMEFKHGRSWEIREGQILPPNQEKKVE